MLFFHKKEHRSYQFDLNLGEGEEQGEKRVASYVQVGKRVGGTKGFGGGYPVKVVCSVGSVPLKEERGQSETEGVKEFQQ